MRCYCFDSGATDPPRCRKVFSALALRFPLFCVEPGFLWLTPIGIGQIAARFVLFWALAFLRGGLPSDLQTDISSSEMSSIMSCLNGLSFLVLSVVDCFRPVALDPDFTGRVVLGLLSSVSSVSLLELICVELF